MSSVVTVNDVHKRLGGAEIVRGITLEIVKGEVMAVIGASGAGKSTLLRCINYLAPFDAGEVVLAGHRLVPGMRATEPAVLSARREAGMVFQDFQLFPHLSALANVALGPRRVLQLPKKEALERARRVLEKVHLGDKMDAYPAQLSGGQRQRVGIARALAMEPKLLLLDEPTSALDPMLKGEVARVIVELKREGLTMLLVTHEHDLVRAAADRALHMQAGKIVDEGRPDKVLENVWTPG